MLWSQNADYISRGAQRRRETVLAGLAPYLIYNNLITLNLHKGIKTTQHSVIPQPTSTETINQSITTHNIGQAAYKGPVPINKHHINTVPAANNTYLAIALTLNQKRRQRPRISCLCCWSRGPWCGLAMTWFNPRCDHGKWVESLHRESIKIHKKER